MKYHLVFFFFLILLISGCSNNVPDLVNDSQEYSSSSTPEINPTLTFIPSTPTLLSTLTPKYINQLCSPLADVPLTELSQIISQPFKLPPAGFDYDHQGVDFSFYRLNGQVGILGTPVNSVLTGTIVAVMQEKYVYGNALIIETPLEQIPESWLEQIQLPALSPTITPDSRLTCPVVENNSYDLFDVHKRSIYILYAHLNQPPSVRIGDKIQCGQLIGEVGNSGKSTNPHLHVETRIGPSGATFAGMAHYDNRANSEEMHNYCVWRVSNLFQMFDPMRLLSITT